MDTLLIVNEEGIYIEHPIWPGVLNIGPQNENDIILPINPSSSISFIKNDNYCIPKINGESKSSEGAWGKKLKKQSVLIFENYTFIYLPNIQIKKSKIKDWDASKFPKNSEKLDYPERLLEFLLTIIEADQGAILLFKESSLTTLATKKIKLRDQSELFLQRILESKNDEMVVNMSYNNHTLLFKAGLTPLDFCLIQYPIGDMEKVVLYLPRTRSMGELPKGIMTTLLSLSAGNLVNHLLFERHRELQQQIGNIEFDFFWGNSKKMISLKSYVDKLCKTNLSILIQGETGTGKEMLVKYMKQKAKVRKVVSVNCAAIPKDLAESVLFGHKKGAFTGAHNDQLGKIQEANGGILFLDEIGELDLNVQAKILRAIQENKISPIGGKEVDVAFWLICATHRNIDLMIQEGSFREDLFFRINEAKVNIPSLSEHSQDIPFLATHFVDEVIMANKLEKRTLSSEVIDHLKAKKWKGNIRELRGYIRKIVLLSDSEIIDANSLHSLRLIENMPNSLNYPDELQDAKRIFVESHIKKILEKCNGNKSQSARVMGITTRNLYRLLPEKRDNLDLHH